MTIVCQNVNGKANIVKKNSCITLKNSLQSYQFWIGVYLIMKKSIVMLLLSGPVWADSCVDGWHFGVGVGVVSQSTSVRQDDCWYEDASPANTLYPTVVASSASGNWNKAPKLKLGSSRATRLAAALEVGYSKLFCNNFYLGGVVSADLTTNKTGGNLITIKSDGYPSIGVFREVRIVNDGVVPFVGARFGYYDPEHKGSIGLRFGGAYVGSKAHLMEHTSGQRYTVKLKNFTPAVGLEFAKELSSSFGIKVQVDYRFKSTRHLGDDFDIHYDAAAGNAERTSVKLSTSGIAVRVMCTCNLSAFK